MKKKKIIIYSSTALAVLFAGILIGRITGNTKTDPHAGHDHAAEQSESAPSTWTCSMHPQIQQPAPGDCPICGMDLIPLIDDDGGDLGPREMSMSESSLALAEIQTQAVLRSFPDSIIRLVGKLEYDESREQSLSARFPARIDKLFVNYTGISVKKGEHLATIYSPELLTAQRELLTTHRNDPQSAFTLAAREKLRLWDLLPDQIDQILASGEATDHFDLKAPIGGVVVNKHVKEGEYVKQGQSLFKIVDFSQLWLNLDAYESDLIWLKYGQTVVFSVESFPGQSFEGQIAFINPEVDRKTRTAQVRVNVSNTDRVLKPGMFAKGKVVVRLSDSGKVHAPEFAGKWISPMHPEIVKDGPGSCDVCGMDLVPAETLGYVTENDATAPLIVPTSAVLRTGKRAVVYLRKPNTERPTFEGREIEIGPRAGDVFIVASGLQEGDLVVTNGAFKIDSALQIQAKPSMMNPSGGGAVPGHNHGDSSAQPTHKASSIEIPVHTASQIIDGYLALQDALASDDQDLAKEIAKSMMSITGHSGALPDLLHSMLAAQSINEIREPHFITLSNAMVEVVSTNPKAFEGDLFLMNCSMANNNKGADWLQSSDQLRNPYYGSMMLKCGDVKQNLTNGQPNSTHEHSE